MGIYQKDIAHTMRPDSSKISELDRMQRADHDTLIVIRSTVEEIKNDLKELNDGLKTRIREAEIRIQDNENTIGIIKNDLKGLTSSLKLILAVVVAIGAFVTWASGVFNNLFSAWR